MSTSMSSGPSIARDRRDVRRSLEEQIAPELKFFAADLETIRSDVQKSLEAGKHTGFQRFLYAPVLEKPSVSYRTTLLSLVFVVSWGLLIVMTVFR